MSLVFTDMEGSTELLRLLGEAYGEVLEAHHRLLRGVWSTYDGVEVSAAGDAFLVAFESARRAVEAVSAAQSALSAHEWPAESAVRVRMGVHTGEPQQYEGTYWGVEVQYAARLCSAAHGGQVLLSAATRALVPDAEVDDLGELALRDFVAPRRLFHLVVDGRHADSFPPPRTLSSTRTNLPSLATPLVGRERELLDLRWRLTESPQRLVTITGAGGSGKTKLAIVCGAELRERFADGVFLVGLAPVVEDEGVLHALVQALGVSPHPSGEECGLTEFLAGRELLLVIDNFEHLLPASLLVGRLLEAAPRLRVLVTSQAPLNLSMESVFRLEPLELPARGETDVNRLGDVASVRLFVERAETADPGFALTTANAEAVAAICRTVDGLPLALELAAARVRMLGAAGVLTALKAGVDVLSGGSRDLPDRQRGLRAALDFTVSLLSEDARVLFRALGAFADAWTIDQAERVAGGGLVMWEAMASLVDLSLVRARGDGRLTMAQRVASHARDLLAGSGEEEVFRRRHAELMAELMDLHFIDSFIDTEAASVAARDLVEEVESAIVWSRDADTGMYARLLAVSAGALGFFNRLRPHIPGIKRHSEGLGAADRGASEWMHARVAVEMNLRNWDAALPWIQRCLEHPRRTARPGELRLAVMWQQIWTLMQAKDFARARVAVGEALAAARLHPDPRWGDLFEGALAFIAVEEGEYDEAEEGLQAVVARPERTDTAALAAPAYLADCAFGRVDGTTALARYLSALETVLRVDSIPDALIQLSGVAASLALCHREAEAAVIVGGVRRHGIEKLGNPDPYVGIPPVISTLQALPQSFSRAEWGRLLARGAQLDFDELVETAKRMGADQETPAGHRSSEDHPTTDSEPVGDRLDLAATLAPHGRGGPVELRVPPAKLGRYRLISRLGAGGMGEVFEAQDTQLDRRVAVKLIAGGIAQSARAKRRFERECRLAAAIDHPHVLPVYEAGECDGDLYLAMRYVEGADLNTLARALRGLDAERAVTIVSQVASALDAIHAHGLVHRDVKPGNILITEVDGRDHAYLCDFGIASALEPQTGGATTTGQFMGTFGYSAPEQLRREALDRRADVYALGHVLFAALTGHSPFDGLAEAHVIAAALSGTTPSLAGLDPEISRLMDPVIAKATAADPDARFPSAGEFAASARLELDARRQARGR